MKYEVRMTIDFQYRDKQGYLNGVKRSTIIDYVDAENIAKAYITAARNKLSIALDITKEMKNTSRWGGTINKVSISLDAVVAKPELSVNRFGIYGFKIHDRALTEEEIRKNYEKGLDYSRYETKGGKRICLHCGKEFKPEHKKQRLCNKCL